MTIIHEGRFHRGMKVRNLLFSPKARVENLGHSFCYGYDGSVRMVKRGKQVYGGSSITYQAYGAEWKSARRKPGTDKYDFRKECFTMSSEQSKHQRSPS